MNIVLNKILLKASIVIDNNENKNKSDIDIDIELL